jgi:hypothetical protein
MRRRDFIAGLGSAAAWPVAARFKAGEAVMEIARTFGVDRATIYRLAEASA